MQSIQFALFYTICVFAFGFAFGVIRTKYVAPKIGKTYAVLLELPFIIVASYFIVNYLNSKIIAPNRILITVFSLIFLLLIEFLFAKFLFKMSFGKFLNKYKKADGQLGFIGQICFALLPLFFT